MKLKTRLIMGLLGILGFGGGTSAQQPVKIGDSLQKAWKTLENTTDTLADRNYYALTLSSNGCNFEVWINDCPVFKYFGPGGYSGMIPINSYIPQSGPQRLRVKLHPVQGHEERGIQDKEPLWIEVRRKPDPGLDLDHYKTILGNFLPPVPVGQPHFEYETTFEAEVPYRLHSWSDCVDLRGTPNLKEELVALAQQVGRWVKEGNFEALARMEAEALAEVSYSYYMNYEETGQEMTNIYRMLSRQKFTLTPDIGECELEFSADGRLVTLVYPRYHLRGLLLMRNDKEGYALPFRFGKRKGSDRLEVILQDFS